MKAVEEFRSMKSVHIPSDYEALVQRRAVLTARQRELCGVPLPAFERPVEPEKPVCHWEQLLKEMVNRYPEYHDYVPRDALLSQKWLANDFSNERTRHRNNSKKAMKAIEVYHKTKDSRNAKKAKVRLSCGGYDILNFPLVNRIIYCILKE